MQHEARRSAALLVGSKGTCTWLHIDSPLAAPTLVCVLVGKKAMCAFPYDNNVPREFIHPERDMTSEFFADICAYAIKCGGFSVELNQGDAVNIPGNWWHAAYNVEATISANLTYLAATDVPEVVTATAEACATHGAI